MPSTHPGPVAASAVGLDLRPRSSCPGLSQSSDAAAQHKCTVFPWQPCRGGPAQNEQPML